MSTTRPQFAGDAHPEDIFTALIVSARYTATALAHAVDTDPRQALLDQHARILTDLTRRTSRTLLQASRTARTSTPST